ncbi:hypothetical protein ACHAW6_008350 [Cyclotella cf. meneghiniana]
MKNQTNEELGIPLGRWMYHTKDTNTECLSDTVHFHHKHITNPSLTQHDTHMQSIAKCAFSVNGVITSQKISPNFNICLPSQNLKHHHHYHHPSSITQPEQWVNPDSHITVTKTTPLTT